MKTLVQNIDTNLRIVRDEKQETKWKVSVKVSFVPTGKFNKKGKPILMRVRHSNVELWGNFFNVKFSLVSRKGETWISENYRKIVQRPYWEDRNGRKLEDKWTKKMNHTLSEFRELLSKFIGIDNSIQVFMEMMEG